MQKDRPLQLDTGNVIAARMTQPLIFRASQIGELEIRYFRLAPDLLGGFFTIHEENFLQGGEAKEKGPVRLFTTAHAAARHFAELLTAPRNGNPIDMRGKMLDVIVAALAEELARQHDSHDRRGNASERFLEIITSLPAAEIQNCTVAELAGKCGCSERHFTRLFRGHFGFSVRAKQTEMRLQRALRLLRDSDEKILYVAIESGFRHLGLFNAMFKRRFGMTPSEWRRQLSDQPTARRGARLSLE